MSLAIKEEISVVFEFPLENDAVEVGRCSWIDPPLEGDKAKISEALDTLIANSTEVNVNWPLEKTKKSATKLYVAKIRAHGDHRDMCTVRKNLEEFGVCYISRQERHQFSAINAVDNKSVKKNAKKSSVSKDKKEQRSKNKLKRNSELLLKQMNCEKIKRQRTSTQSTPQKKNDSQGEKNKPKILEHLSVALQDVDTNEPPNPITAFQNSSNPPLNVLQPSSKPSPKFNFTVDNLIHSTFTETFSSRPIHSDSNFNAAEDDIFYDTNRVSSVTPTPSIHASDFENDDVGFKVAMTMAKNSPIRPTPNRVFYTDAITGSYVDVAARNFTYNSPSLHEKSEINHLPSKEKDLKTENKELKITVENQRKEIENQRQEIERLKTLLDTDNAISKIGSNLEHALFLSRNCVKQSSNNCSSFDDFQFVSNNEPMNFDGQEENSPPSKFRRCNHTSPYNFASDALTSLFTIEELANSTLTGEAHGVARKAAQYSKAKLDEERVKQIRDYAEKYFNKITLYDLEKEIKNAIKKKCNNAHNKFHNSKPASGE